MSSKKTLNAKNLEALGAQRLAELLIEISTGNTTAKRRLRLELASEESPATVAREIRKRLATIARSCSFVDWRNRRPLVDDLDMQRRAIVDKVARDDPVEGLDLMWRFMALAGSIFERCDDSSGTVIGIFDHAANDLGEIAKAAKPDPKRLADDAFQALIDNGYGQYDALLQVLTPALGQAGLEHLKQRMTTLSKEPVRKASDGERCAAAHGSASPNHVDAPAERFRASTVRQALTKIADAQGDVDAFIAQYDGQTRKVPNIAAQIARRLLAADRAEEALQTIDTAEHGGDAWDWPDFAWEDARIEVLDALGRGDEAQADRWSCFERALSIPHLRAYLKRLPGFDDFEAEERALDYAQSYENPLRALSFLVSWPALDRAAALTIRRAAALDGNHYELLAPAADAMAGKYPLAATLAFRSMIDFALTHRRSSRYKHAARHFMACSSLASAIEDFGAYGAHDAYEAKLRREHGRKSSFWSVIR